MSPVRPVPRWVRRTVGVLSLALAMTGVLAVLPTGTTSPAAAADLSRFDPGLIITDAAFFNAGTMDVAAVQAFLSARGASCRPAADGTSCLKDARFDTTDKPADDRCTGTYRGGPSQSAAEVVVGVARACGINPQVLLVTLQKEQGLVTATTANASRYRIAMGFGCPDTAPCDTQYYGFFNQVYRAAWQFRNYTLNPTRYSHRAGVVNAVRFYPPQRPECGTSNVLIRNQATANLYNYTPYQPNAAALAAGYGTGDSCSSYGNRNFYAYFTDWFGRPDAGDTTGAVDQLSSTSSTITVGGWAVDPSTSASIDVHVYVDGVGTALTANQPRPDIGRLFGLGDAHGFSVTLPASAGSHSVCAYAIGDRGRPNAGLGCYSVTVVDQPPTGSIDAVITDSGKVTITGWTWDPDTTAPTDVHVYIDGVGASLRADGDRPDVAAAFRTAPTRGYAHTRNVSPGQHTACVYAINTGSGPHTLLGCRDFAVDVAAPIGSIDSVTTSGDQVTITGWTWDPDTTAPTDVHVYIDGVGASLRADGNRPDVAAAFRTAPTRGYAHTRTVGPGAHTACMYAINTGPGGHTLLGCRDFTISSTAPIGAVDSVSVAGGQLSVSGWTWDPDTSAPTDVHVYVDGAGVAIRADLERPDVAAAFGTSATRGYSFVQPVGPGRHTVCVYAINTGPGAHTSLGCYETLA